MIKEINDPTIPYVGGIDAGNFCPDNIIRIQGFIPSISHRFNINLQCSRENPPQSDVALQVAVNMLDKYISLNSLKNMSHKYVSLNSLQNTQWSEQLGALPIEHNQRFEVILACDSNLYKVRINGKHYSEVLQRIHYGRITHLAINGDVSIFRISYESTSEGEIGGPLGNEFSEQLQPSAPTFSPNEFGTATITVNPPYPRVSPPPFSDPSAPPSYEAAVDSTARPPYPTSDSVGMPWPTGALESKDLLLPFPPNGPKMLPRREIGLVPPPSNIIGIHSPSSGTPVPFNMNSSNRQSETQTPAKGSSSLAVRYFLGGIFIIVAIIIFLIKIMVSRTRK